MGPAAADRPVRGPARPGGGRSRPWAWTCARPPRGDVSLQAAPRADPPGGAGHPGGRGLRRRRRRPLARDPAGGRGPGHDRRHEPARPATGRPLARPPGLPLARRGHAGAPDVRGRGHPAADLRPRDVGPRLPPAPGPRRRLRPRVRPRAGQSLLRRPDRAEGRRLLLLDGIAIVLQSVIGLLVLAFYHPYLLGFSVVVLGAMAFIVFVLGRGAVATSIRESRAKYAVAGRLEELALAPLAYKSEGGPSSPWTGPTPWPVATWRRAGTTSGSSSARWSSRWRFRRSPRRRCWAWGAGSSSRDN